MSSKSFEPIPFRESIAEVGEAIRNRRVVPFVGAGISVMSGLPLASDLVDMTTRALIPPELRGSPLGDSVLEASKETGFEPFLGIVYKSILERVFPLLYVFNQGQPNSIHHFFSELVRRGYSDRVFTTNFDNLLEQAIRSHTKTVNVASDEEDFTKSLQPAVLKLHGSVDKVKTFVATILQVGLLPQSKRSVLEQLLDEREFLFIGWNNHDLDITPILRHGTHRFYWVQHSESTRAFRYFPDDQPSLAQSMQKRLVSQHGGLWIETPVPHFLGSLASYLGLPSLDFVPNPDTDIVQSQVKATAKEWAEALSDEERLLTCGHLLFLKGRWRESAEVFKTLAAHLPSNPPLRLEVEIYAARSLVELLDLERAVATLDELIREADLIEDELKRTILMSEALALRGIGLAKKVEAPVLWLISPVDNGQLEKALEDLHASLRYAEIVAKRNKRGSFMVMNQWGNIGSNYLMRWDFDSAEKAFGKCYELSEKLHNPFTQALTSFNLAAIECHREGGKPALDTLRVAVEQLEVIGEAHSTAVALLTLAWIQNRQGFVKEAKASALKSLTWFEHLPDTSETREMQSKLRMILGEGDTAKNFQSRGNL
ncbi:MAG: hypothetical protein E3J35_02420 [Methanomassiliicoccales archaeon]|nr:MAG: hypothetical protein E3J35_02420 [Methanomassiliicoccales archaeon]